MIHPNATSLDASDRASGEVRVGFVICDPAVSFGAIVGLGAKERASELGVDLSIVSVFTPDQQAPVIDRLAAGHIDVLIVKALESDVVVPALREAAAAGIPVIVADGRIDGIDPACSVCFDNVKGAELAAAFLVERLQERGTIAHLQGPLTSANGHDRSRGFHNVVDSCSAIQIVAASSDWTREAGAAAMRELLENHALIEAVFANSDALALGAVDAIEEADRTGQIVVTGFDALPDALLAIARGTIAATVRQMPEAMGRLAVELALRVHAGEEVPPVVETDVALVTSANVAQASLEALPLFPRILLDLAESGTALAEERTLLRTLIDNLPDLIYVKDVNGRFLLVNEAAAAYIGAATRDDAVGKSDFDFFPHEYASQYRADEEAVLASGRPLINHEEPAPDITGDTHWFSTTKVPTRDESGRVVGLVGMSRDITRRKEEEADRARLVEEQEALRRVAMLAARELAPVEVLVAVTEEAARALNTEAVGMLRFEHDGAATLVAQSRTPWDPPPLGTRFTLDGENVVAAVHRTGRTARMDDWTNATGSVAAMAHVLGVRSAVATPIIVEGRLWGTMIAVTNRSEPLPADIEARIGEFTELVATAIANAQSREALAELAEEQGALRRVATLVAEGVDAEDIFDAVCQETCRLLDATTITLSHYTADGFNMTMAGWSLDDAHLPIGTRLPLEPDTVGGAIVRTRAPARVDSWDGLSSELAKLVRASGARSSLGAPIVVEGQLWGALVAGTDREEPLPAGTEFRLARFTELIATAISNAAARSELIDSRARIVAAGDEARQRIERNLHDGTQQRLIALGLDIQRVRATIPEDQHDAHLELERVEEALGSVLDDLRELSRGLHPPLLSRRGLRSSLRALARNSPIPVELEIDLPERPPAPLETAVYYVVSEALTNAIKHSQASVISITIETDHAGEPFGVGLDGRSRGVKLHATIADDGVGGADASAGSGLTGLADRVEALGGRFALDTPSGGGTRISIELPLEIR